MVVRIITHHTRYTPDITRRVFIGCQQTVTMTNCNMTISSSYLIYFLLRINFSCSNVKKNRYQ